MVGVGSPGDSPMSDDDGDGYGQELELQKIHLFYSSF